MLFEVFRKLVSFRWNKNNLKTINTVLRRRFQTPFQLCALSLYGYVFVLWTELSQFNWPGTDHGPVPHLDRMQKMSGRMRDRTGETNSRDQILLRDRGQSKLFLAVHRWPQEGFTKTRGQRDCCTSHKHVTEETENNRIQKFRTLRLQLLPYYRDHPVEESQIGEEWWSISACSLTCASHF